MENFLIITICIALLSAFYVQLLKKLGVIDYMQIHGNDFFYQLSKCDFCLSFWACLLTSTCYVFFDNVFDYKNLIIPFFATPLTRILL